jgi:hypothetical protein
MKFHAHRILHSCTLLAPRCKVERPVGALRLNGTEETGGIYGAAGLAAWRVLPLLGTGGEAGAGHAFAEAAWEKG